MVARPVSTRNQTCQPPQPDLSVRGTEVLEVSVGPDSVADAKQQTVADAARPVSVRRS
jgi:hypothetical protein